jgi:16S rRNA (cytosine967-C5)-methyltransferase
MQPRDLALSLLSRKAARKEPWGNPLDEVFQKNPHLTARDRAFVSHLVQGVWRWRGRLDWMIAQASNRPFQRISPVVLNILRLALYQICYMDRVPDSAAVNEAVLQVKAQGAARAAPFVNGLLRSLCRDRQGIAFPDSKHAPVPSLAAVHSFPEWLVERWLRSQGLKETEALLCALNRIPPLCVRANRLRMDRDGLLERLTAEGVTAEAFPGVPEALCIQGLRGRVDRLASYEEGLFQVQDPGAEVAAHLLAPAPGESVLDLCAGFGGKATHLAELAKDQGRVVALDIQPKRLVHLRRSAQRLGLRSIVALAGDGTKDLGRLFQRPFDAILVDAPCSGLGVLSRHPDGKWNRTEEDIPRLASLQRALLHGAAEVLREGGRLLFVTCTLTNEENEDTAQAFLETHQDMTRVNLRERVPEWALPFIDDQGFFRAVPHRHGTDGFFGALFEKESGPGD